MESTESSIYSRDSEIAPISERTRNIKIVIDDDDEEVEEQKEMINKNGTETDEDEVANTIEVNGERMNATRCPDCEAFRANAQNAWKILNDFQRLQEESRKYKNEKEQLERICDENRTYIETLRRIQEESIRLTKEKDQTIIALQDRIRNVEDQYDRVCKARLAEIKAQYIADHNAKAGITEKGTAPEEVTVDQARITEEDINLEEDTVQPAEIEEQPIEEDTVQPAEITEEDINQEEAIVHQAGITEEDINQEEAIVHQAGITEENINQEEAIVHQAGITEEDINPDEDKTQQIEITEEDITTEEDNTQQIEITEEDTAPEDTVQPAEITEEDTTSEDTVQPAGIAEEETTPEDTVQQAGISEEDTAPEEVTVQPAEITKEDTAPEDTVQQAEIAEEETTPAEEDIVQQAEIAEEKEKTHTTQEAKVDEPVKNNVTVTTIATIFSSSFFAEMSRMPLIEDIAELPFLFPEMLVLGSPKVKAQPQSHQTQPQMPEIKIIPGQPAHFAIQQIAKIHKIDIKQATLYYTHAQRENAKKVKRRYDSSGDEASVGTSTSQGSPRKNSKGQMPWKPQKAVIPTGYTRSCLPHEDHKRYIGIIANKLKSNPTYRFEHNKIEIKALDQQLVVERADFEKIALQMIKSNMANFGAYKYQTEWRTLFMSRQQTRVENYVGNLAFQGSILRIPWPDYGSDFSAEPPPQNYHIRTVKVLSPGEAPSISIPSIQNKFILDTRGLKTELRTPQPPKLDIFHDQDIRDYALANDVSLLIDASTLRHLMCSTWSHRLQKYAYRLSVVQLVHGGKLRKLHIISPPFLACRIHKTAIPQAFAKWALKTNLLVDKEKEDAFIKANNQRKTPKKKMKHEEEDEDDFARTLLNELGLGDLDLGTTSSQRKSGRRYAIVSLNDSTEKGGSNSNTNEEQAKHQVVVRTRVHAVEKATKRRISICGRVEFLPELGAEKFSDEEILWNTLTGLLKGSDEHLNFRIRTAQNEPAYVLQYARKASTDLSFLSAQTSRLLRARIQRVCTLIDSINDLVAGEYLVVPDQDDEEILQIVGQRKPQTEPAEQAREDAEADDNGDYSGLMIDDEAQESSSDMPAGKGVVYDADWFIQIIKCKVISSPNEIADYWNGIDPHYPLQWHVVLGQIPGALLPRELPAFTSTSSSYGTNAFRRQNNTANAVLRQNKKQLFAKKNQAKK